jgi:hypothetical protein
MDATVSGEEVKEGEEIYVSREELLAENPQNPKICGGMEVEFLVAKTSFDKFCACEVTLPGGDPIGELPEREPREGGKSKGKGKSAKGQAPAIQKTIVKPGGKSSWGSSSKGSWGKGSSKGKGKGKGKSKW